MVNCPHCKKTIIGLVTSYIQTPLPNGELRVAVLHGCSMCRTVLSVGLDPLEVRDEIIKEVSPSPEEE